MTSLLKIQKPYKIFGYSKRFIAYDNLYPNNTLYASISL